MMRDTLYIFFLLAAMPVALAHSDGAEGLEIGEVHAPAMTNAKTLYLPVYMTIRNRGQDADRLLAARTPYADKVELIELRNQIGMNLPMSTESLLVAPGTSLELNPYGPRLLVSGLKQPLQASASFPMTLVFEKAGPIQIEVTLETQTSGQPNRP
jgi:periplasmic copper chaperone A